MNDIQKLRELLSRSAETPWSLDGYWINSVDDDCFVAMLPDEAGSEITGDLIVTAVNALPDLLNEIEALRKSNTECIEEINEMSHNCNELKGEIEALRKQSAEPARKMKLPEGREIARTYMGVIQSLTVYFRKNDVIAALEAAGVEVTE